MCVPAAITHTATLCACMLLRIRPVTDPHLRDMQLGTSGFKILLQEGRNRQIRKMCEALGYHVVSLHRTEFAGIGLQRLKPGQWRDLSAQEFRFVEQALQSAGEAFGGPA
jgi:16S rRNA U516 pseudouridylate synthase RsuA-like enzyme